MKFQGLDYFAISNTAVTDMLFFFANRNFTVHPIDETLSTQCLEEPGQTHTEPVCQEIFNDSRKHIMNRKALSALSLSLAALVAGNAFAADASAPKTRDQVRAELVQAQSTGDILAQGNSGKLLNELYPSRYPAKVAAHGYTREQVMADLAEARRTGNILAPGNTGEMLNELYPSRYPAKVAAHGYTREQVMADLAEARRTGNILAPGNTGEMLNELYPSQYPAKAVTQGVTRAQVVAELEQTQRSGDDFRKIYGNH